VAWLYCPGNGRPALDPVVMFKALFIGYLFGIRSDAPAGARDRDKRGLSLVFVAAPDRWGVRCLDPEPKPAAVL